MVFTTAGSAAADAWRLELLQHLDSFLGQGDDVGDHRRYARAWVSCKLYDDEARVQVDAPPNGTGFGRAALRLYDTRTVNARDVAYEIQQRMLPEIGQAIT